MTAPYDSTIALIDCEHATIEILMTGNEMAGIIADAVVG